MADTDWFVMELGDGRLLAVDAYAETSPPCHCCNQRHIADFQILSMRLYKNEKDLKGRKINPRVLGADWPQIRARLFDQLLKERSPGKLSPAAQLEVSRKVRGDEILH